MDIQKELIERDSNNTKCYHIIDTLFKTFNQLYSSYESKKYKDIIMYNTIRTLVNNNGDGR